MLPIGKIARNHFTIQKRERESKRRLGFHPRRRIGRFEASCTQIGMATGFLDHEGTDLVTRLTSDGDGDDDDMVFDSLSLSVSLSPSLSLSA